MGIITGYIAAVLLVVLLIKFIARKCKLQKLNKALMKAHKYIAFAFLIVSIIHFVLVIPVLEGRDLLVTISGIAILVVGLFITVLCHVIKNKKQNLKLHQVLSIGILLLLIVHLVVYFIDFGKYIKAIDEIEVTSVDLNYVEDGEYYGEYSTGYVAARVKVTVDNHAITNVELIKHINEKGKPAESITDTIKAKQNVKVDAVSGATNSSKVIMKACENALKNR